jgi:hypothetical protein
MNDENPKGKRHPAKIPLQISQISAENAPSLGPKASAQLRGEPGLSSEESEILFLEQALHRPVLLEREHQALIQGNLGIGLGGKFPTQEYKGQCDGPKTKHGRDDKYIHTSPGEKSSGMRITEYLTKCNGSIFGPY